MRNDSTGSMCQIHLKFIVVNLISLIFGLSQSKEEMVVRERERVEKKYMKVL